MLTMLAALAIAAAAPDDAVIGRWRTETRNGIVEITPCGASICGRLIGSDGLRANPALTDLNNKDPSMRRRPLDGLRILSGFTRADGAWDDGTIYNGEDGKTYGARVTPQDRDHLLVRGCIFVPFCKTQTWTRVR